MRNPNPQNVNPEQPNQKNLNPGQNQMNEEPSADPMERLVVLENLVAEMLNGFNMTGQAINRLETFTFSIVAAMLKKDFISYEELAGLQQDLMSHDNLLKFWGVSPEEAAASSVPGAEEMQSNDESTTSS
jgi:hypothetical protein